HYTAPIHVIPPQPVTRCALGQLSTGVLFIYRRAQPVTIVLYDKYYRQAPDSCHIACFMKITLTRTAISRKSQGYLLFLVQLMRQCNSISNRHLRAKVRYHTTLMFIIVAIEECKLATLAEPLYS